ncbi:MAG: right-handed parallel beta-helix repeat-containing protein, partial [Limnochordia bacterium]|nr:right-handed parallel beta-helix repeat-containing protein [Limnochordia bacterium]
ITIGNINVTVEGFEVDPGTHGIDISLISAGNVVTIEDTHIFGNTENGINVGDVYGTLNVINSHIYDNGGTGIYIDQVDGGFVNIEDNTIENNSGTGIHIVSIDADSAVNIEDNTIENNSVTGIHIVSIDADSAVNINYNSIVGNTNGVVNDSAVEIDATNNWWGDVAGPSIGTNPYDGKTSGDSVSDNVLYIPWLIQGELNAGWNIWSFPIAVDEATAEELFMAPLLEDNVEAAYFFDSTTQLWGNPDDAGPMDAIYVKMEEPATVRYSISSDATFPAQKEMKAGWNLVGLAELYAMDVNDALISIDLVAGDLTGYSHVSSPSLTGAPWIHFRGGDDSFTMLPTKGYWVFMVNDGVLGGFASTPIIEVSTPINEVAG